MHSMDDTRSMPGSRMRERHIKRHIHSRIGEFLAGLIRITPVNEDGSDKVIHEIEFKHAMILPAITGYEAVTGIERFLNPRDFIIPRNAIPAMGPDFLIRATPARQVT